MPPGTGGPRAARATVWFAACWLFASGKDGISALSLQQTLEIGSCQTAWMLLHRLRAGLVRPGRQRLTGRVEADESFFGGEEPGPRGGRARGKKVLVGIAVEVHEPRGFGRCRRAVLADASRSSLHPFVLEHIEPGSTVLTDAWMGYLNEFVSRFNRRGSPSRGMVVHRVLEQAVVPPRCATTRSRSGNGPRAQRPLPPVTRGHPPSLELPPHPPGKSALTGDLVR